MVFDRIILMTRVSSRWSLAMAYDLHNRGFVATSIITDIILTCLFREWHPGKTMNYKPQVLYVLAQVWHFMWHVWK